MIKQKYAESRDKRGQPIKIGSPADALAVFIATGGGAGLIPLGPGTWGSLVGVIIAYGLIVLCGADVLLLQNVLIAASVVTAAAGIWAGTRAEFIFQQKDPSQAVIDEVCGQIITFSFIAAYLPRLGERWRLWIIVGFVLFRLFDIFKPYPINKLQDLTGGFGVMMDDILAGIYAAATLSLLLWWAT
jgi:phosphatidylglycerophosphatase A